MNAIIQFFHFQNNLYIFLCAYVRLGLVFYTIPMFGSKISSNIIMKNTLIFVVSIGLWPTIKPIVGSNQSVFLLFFKEAVVGLLLGLSLSAPFWVASSLGEIVDNQRGASMAETFDPMSNSQHSILSGLFNFTFCTFFIVRGGFQFLMKALQQSYILFPRGFRITSLHWHVLAMMLDSIFQYSVMLASPIIITLVLSDILLGVFSRFCPQLNPFSLSLAIKTFVMVSVFVLYGYQSLFFKPFQLFFSYSIKRFIS